MPHLEVFLLIPASCSMNLPLLATFLPSNISYDLYVGKFIDEVLANLSIRHLNVCTIQPIFPSNPTVDWSNRRSILTCSCSRHCCSYRCSCWLSIVCQRSPVPSQLETSQKAAWELLESSHLAEDLVNLHKNNTCKYTRHVQNNAVGILTHYTKNTDAKAWTVSTNITKSHITRLSMNWNLVHMSRSHPSCRSVS